MTVTYSVHSHTHRHTHYTLLTFLLYCQCHCHVSRPTLHYKYKVSECCSPLLQYTSLLGSYFPFIAIDIPILFTFYTHKVKWLAGLLKKRCFYRGFAEQPTGVTTEADDRLCPYEMCRTVIEFTTRGLCTQYTGSPARGYDC